METENSRKRRRYVAELKAQILAVAMARGINANIVHGWRKLAREAGTAPVPERFVPVAIAPAVPRVADERTIEMELRRSGITVKLACPRTQPASRIVELLPHHWQPTTST